MTVAFVPGGGIAVQLGLGVAAELRLLADGSWCASLTGPAAACPVDGRDPGSALDGLAVRLAELAAAAAAAAAQLADG